MISATSAPMKAGRWKIVEASSVSVYFLLKKLLTRPDCCGVAVKVSAFRVSVFFFIDDVVVLAFWVFVAAEDLDFDAVLAFFVAILPP